MKNKILAGLIALVVLTVPAMATTIDTWIDVDGTSYFEKSFEAGHVRFNEVITNDESLKMHEHIYAFPVSTDDDGNPVPSTGVYESKHIDVKGTTSFYEWAEIGGQNWQKEGGGWHVEEPLTDVITAYIEETINNNGEMTITKILSSKGDWNLEEVKWADGKGDIEITKNVGFWTNTIDPDPADKTELWITQEYHTDDEDFTDHGYFISDEERQFGWDWTRDRPSPNFGYYSNSPDTKWFDYTERAIINPLWTI